jgi:hypothetical protein
VSGLRGVDPSQDLHSLAFLKCETDNKLVPTLSRKTHATHHRIKIKRVYRPYLTATEAEAYQVHHQTGRVRADYLNAVYRTEFSFKNRPTWSVFLWTACVTKLPGRHNAAVEESSRAIHTLYLYSAMGDTGLRT